MVLTALVWLYVTAICFACGTAADAALRRALPPARGRTPSSLLPILGLAALAPFAATLSLFGGLGRFADIALLLGAVACAAMQRKTCAAIATAALHRLRRLDPFALGLALFALALVLEAATRSAIHYDTGLYHAQAIRWAEQYGAVPGLGNLHYRLALDSSWFPLVALFGFTWLGFGPLYVLGGWLFAWTTLLLVLRLDALCRGSRSSAALLGTLLLCVLSPLLGTWISSPAPDLAVALLIWLLLLTTWEAGELSTADADAARPSLLLLSSFLLTLKLAATPVMLLIALFVILESRRQRRAGFAALAIVLGYGLPFAVRNTLLSGYPVFPITSFTPFSFDWQIPISVGKSVHELIRSWARVPGGSPGEVLALPLSGWLPAWFARLHLPNLLLLAAIPAGIVLRAARVLMRRHRRAATWTEVPVEQLAVAVTAVAGTAFWFALAPDPRFGVGFYAFLALLLYLPWLAAARVFVRRGGWIAIASLYILQQLTVSPVPLFGGEDSVFRGARLLRPAPYRVPSTVSAPLANAVVQKPTDGDQCWYEPFPCTPYPGPSVARRGDSWAEGFRAVGP